MSDFSVDILWLLMRFRVNMFNSVVDIFVGGDFVSGEDIRWKN